MPNMGTRRPITPDRPATAGERGDVAVRPMQSEYDFSKAERGRFYRPNAKFNMPTEADERLVADESEKAPDAPAAPSPERRLTYSERQAD